MATIDWPSGLDAALVGTLVEDRVANYANDKATVGAPKRRARFTRTLKAWKFTIRLDATTYTTLNTFIDTTSNGGVTSFDWTHPVTAVEYEVRFAELPSIKNVSQDIWDAAISIEQI